jgi:hypothetical protein
MATRLHVVVTTKDKKLFILTMSQLGQFRITKSQIQTPEVQKILKKTGFKSNMIQFVMAEQIH